MNSHRGTILREQDIPKITYWTIHKPIVRICETLLQKAVYTFTAILTSVKKPDVSDCGPKKLRIVYLIKTKVRYLLGEWMLVSLPVLKFYVVGNQRNECDIIFLYVPHGHIFVRRCRCFCKCSTFITCQLITRRADVNCYLLYKHVTFFAPYSYIDFLWHPF
jgi:hypothetical protein